MLCIVYIASLETRKSNESCIYFRAKPASHFEPLYAIPVYSSALNRTSYLNRRKNSIFDLYLGMFHVYARDQYIISHSLVYDALVYNCALKRSVDLI